MRRGHPSARQLAGWLANDRPARIGRHVADCEVCATRLDEMTGLEPGLRGDLALAVEPPSGIEDRTGTGVRERMAGEEALSVFADLFTLGWRTVELIVDTEERPDA